MSEKKVRGREAPLQAGIVKGELVIRIGVEVLAFAAMEGQKNEMNVYYKVTDVDEFAKEVMLAMLHEEEDGSSPLTDFLDAAGTAAVEDGSIGVEHVDPPLTEHCPACFGDGCDGCGKIGYIVAAPEGEDEDEEE